MGLRALPQHLRELVAIAQSGGERAAPAEVARRTDICLKCPCFNPADHRCGVCGCPIKRKTLFTRAHCPDNPPRW